VSSSSINAWLDQWPRVRVRIGDAIVPAYFACGMVGVGAGALAVLLLAVWTGASAAVAAAVCALACATFLVFSLLRWWITGVQKIVLLEQFAVVLLTAYGVLSLCALPALAYVDLLTVGLATFLVAGRIGCFVTGCCYGVEAGIGVSYPKECGHHSRARRMPLQLVESIAWAILTAAAALAVIFKPEGTALELVLIAYGALRSMLEPLRGDPRRRWLWLTEGGWLAALAIGMGAWLHDRSLAISAITLGGSAAFAALVTVLISATRRSWLALSFTGSERAHVERAASELKAAELGAVPVVCEAGDLIFAASRVEDGAGKGDLNISVSSRGRKLDHAEATMTLEWLMRTWGIDAGDLRPVEAKNGVFLTTLRGAG